MSDHSKPPDPKPALFGRHTDLLAALASGVVGAAALVTSTYNVYLQRQQVRAQVLPRLTLSTDFTNDGLSYIVYNRGVGPAEIRRVRVAVDGKPQPDWIAAVTSLLHKTSLDYVPHMSELDGQVMSPGQDMTPLRIPRFDAAAAVMAERRRLDVEICYCSTLDDCWVLREPGQGESSTVPVSSCARDAKPFKAVSDETMDQIVALAARQAREAEDAGAAAPDGSSDATRPPPRRRSP